MHTGEQGAGSGALASSPDATAAVRPTEASASSLGAINLGRHEFGRVGHSHLQGASKRQADPDDFFRCQTAPWKYSYMLGGMFSSCACAMCLRTVSEYWKRSPQMRQCH